MAENIFEGVNGLILTEVRVFPFKEDLGHLKALAVVTFNGSLTVRGLRVMDGTDGLFVSYPLDPFYRGEDIRSVVKPEDAALKAYVEEKVLAEYARVTDI